MARHGLPPHPDHIEPRTHPSDERCDRAHVERARWRVTNSAGQELTLCNYHYRRYEVPLAMEGWRAELIKEEEDGH
jgi:translation elongation factor P/translation initiation factor 5A